jgi:hypothetical protein
MARWPIKDSSGTGVLAGVVEMGPDSDFNMVEYWSKFNQLPNLSKTDIFLPFKN